MSPAKVPRPLKFGVSAADNGPVAIRQNRAESTCPASVVTVQRSAVSSSTAETRVLSAMSRRRSSLSATQFRYLRISAWVAYFSIQFHSCCSSSENE